MEQEQPFFTLRTVWLMVHIHLLQFLSQFRWQGSPSDATPKQRREEAEGTADRRNAHRTERE